MSRLFDDGYFPRLLSSHPYFASRNIAVGEVAVSLLLCIMINVEIFLPASSENHWSTSYDGEKNHNLAIKPIESSIE